MQSNVKAIMSDILSITAEIEQAKLITTLVSQNNNDQSRMLGASATSFLSSVELKLNNLLEKVDTIDNSY